MENISKDIKRRELARKLERRSSGAYCEKRERSKVKECRGVALTQTVYKVYKGILEKRVRKDVEKMGLLPESQAGFRRVRKTIDNIYVLNYLISREIAKKKGKMIVLYVYFKAALYSVDR